MVLYHATVFDLGSVSVPCGSIRGLPIGMQIIGRYFDEPRILGVAAAVERSS